MIIRSICKEDASGFLELCRRLDNETEYMMLEPGERSTTVEEMENRVQGLEGNDNGIVIVAEEFNELVGYVAAYRGEYNRIRHSAYIVTGILKQFCRKGIGTKLFMELDKWAKESGIHRLELTVMTTNRAAITLYKKMGFEIEGIKHRSMCVNGKYVDEYYMGKLFE